MLNYDNKAIINYITFTKRIPPLTDFAVESMLQALHKAGRKKDAIEVLSALMQTPRKFCVALIRYDLKEEALEYATQNKFNDLILSLKQKVK